MDFSIWDVAKRAGVSKSTVSRVLNGNAVGQASYQKVMDAVKEMGYGPRPEGKFQQCDRSTFPWRHDVP